VTASGKSLTRAMPQATDERAPVTFREWKDALAAAVFTPAEKARMTHDILGFLRHCKVLHVPASIARAKTYIESAEAQARSGAGRRRSAALSSPSSGRGGRGIRGPWRGRDIASPAR